jgi:hypothetical protein
VLWLLRRGPHSQPAEALDHLGRPLWERVLSELEQLTPLLTKATSREYGIKSTQVLRRYIEMRYALRAPRLATEEFLVVAGDSKALPEEHRASLHRFLELCDLLKFGRYLAAGSELERLHAAAVEFVLASRPAGLESRPPKEAGC